jgi:hypothetical protein
MTEPVTPPQKAPKVDPGHLLPQEDWDEVQRQVEALQTQDPAYDPSAAARVYVDKQGGAGA